MLPPQRLNQLFFHERAKRMNEDSRHNSEQGPELMCSHTWVKLWMLMCVEETRRDKSCETVFGKAQGPPSTLWNQESVTCFLKVGVNAAPSGGSMLPSPCRFGVQAFSQLHLYCQVCKNKIAVQFCALYLIYVKPVVMFDFCGKNNWKKHHFHQTACK